MMPAEIVALIQQNHESFTAGMNRLNDKIDDVRNNMATHREVDDIRNRLNRAEDSMKKLGEETPNRNDITAILTEMRSSLWSEISTLRTEKKDLEKTVNTMKFSQGRIPSQVWTIAVSSIVSIAGWFVRPLLHI